MYLETSGEAIALADLAMIDPIASGYTTGIYLVGIDIQPGQYRVTAIGDRAAYAARLDDTLEIIDKDLNSGSVIMIINATDCAFSFNGTLELIG